MTVPLKTVLFFSTCAYPDPFVRSIRTTRLSSYLPEFGYKPVVYARYYGHAATAKEVARDVHPEAEVHHLDRPAGSSAKDTVRSKPGLAQRLKRAVGRSGLAQAAVVPDASLKFWRGIRSVAMRAVERHRPDVIFTNAPPISNQDIGLYLKGETGIPWVADYEDPSLIDRRYGPFGVRGLRRSAHEAYERTIYERADLITHVIPMHERWARLRYPFARGKIRGLTMGCPQELADGRVEPLTGEGGRRVVLVVGFMGDAEVLNLARAVEGLVKRGADLELRLVGREPGTAGEIRRLLGDRAVMTGFVAHAEALRHIAGADVLVSYLSPERSSHLLLSSKLFEFLAAGKPVIEINPTRSDRLFLRSVPGVSVLREPGVDALSEALGGLLGRNDVRPASFTESFVAEHGWRRKAERLAGWLDGITAGG